MIWDNLSLSTLLIHNTLLTWSTIPDYSQGSGVSDAWMIRLQLVARSPSG